MTGPPSIDPSTTSSEKTPYAILCDLVNRPVLILLPAEPDYPVSNPCPKPHRTAAFWIVFVTLMFGTPSFAAQQSNPPPCTEYENHNQAYYGPYILEKVKGKITDPEQYVIGNVCVALFTDKEHKLVIATQSDHNGEFSLRGIKPGRYELVVKAYPLCAANVPLRVVKKAKKKQVLRVYMKPRGMDDCSYGEAVRAN